MNDKTGAVARRDAAIKAMLPHVAEDGWTFLALDQAQGPQSRLMFPGGPVEMVEAYIDMADRDMVTMASPMLVEQRLSRRVRTLIATRLAQGEPHKIAVRRAVSVLSRPANAGLAARCTARTADAIWHAAGDSAADFSWYTKRAILAGVYTSTLLFWVSGKGDEVETLAFLDRRLAGVAALGKLRRRLSSKMAA